MNGQSHPPSAFASSAIFSGPSCSNVIQQHIHPMTVYRAWVKHLHIITSSTDHSLEELKVESEVELKVESNVEQWHLLLLVRYLSR
jgi:hypothetical protein